MDVRCELPAFMCVTEKVANDGEGGSEDLEWNMPPRLDNLSALVSICAWTYEVAVHQAPCRLEIKYPKRGSGGGCGSIG